MSFSACISTGSPEQTREIGRAIGEKSLAGDILLLTGELGAGKTCFIQGLAEGLGVPGYVRSPTFVLTHQYSGRLTLFHLDLYRIDGPLEAWSLGLEEQLFGGGVCAVEWADRAPELFPDSCLWVHLDYQSDSPASDTDSDPDLDPGSDKVASENRRVISFSGGPAHLTGTLQQLAVSHPAGQGGN